MLKGLFLIKFLLMESTISVVIVAFNESEKIEACIKSVKPFADEILLVDSFSEDDTATKALALGVRLIQQQWLGYAAQKNFGNLEAEFDWIFSIDADEIVSPELCNSILKWKADNILKSAYCNRLSSYCGRFLKFGGWYPDKKIRLFYRQDAKWTGSIHETLSIGNKNPLYFLKGDLLHFPVKSTEEHKEQIEKYTEAAAAEMYANGKKYSLLKPWLNASFKFIKDYFFKLGFLDGKIGYRVALLSAYSTYLKYAKLAKLYKTKGL